MPLYEYECAKCGERTEAIQRTSDALLTVCPTCGGALRKLLSAPAFKFKGSGFYITDYGKAGEKAGETTGEKTEEKEKIPSKGEEAKGTSSGAGTGGEAGESSRDSSKAPSKEEKDGATDAAPSTPAAPSAPVPSKKKNSDKK